MKNVFLSAFRTGIITMLTMICFSACVVVNAPDFNSVTPKGDPENYEFKVGQYNRITVEGNLEIRYNARPSDTVILAVQPNIRDYFTVEVIDEELVVRTTRRITLGAGKAPVLTISTPTLNSISLSGAGSFVANDKIITDSLELIIRGAANGKAELEVGMLYAEISGAGEMELSGKADTADLTLSGVGEIKALSLETRDATVNLSGTGSIRVNSSENLHINANGTGSVEYKGAARVNRNTGGLVSVRQIN